jgi:hypothetical protein
MSVFGASRFTVVLAAVALSGTVGTFWWAIQARSDLNAGNRSAHRALSSKPLGRSSRPQDQQSNKFELMGRSERPQTGPSGRSDDQTQSPERAKVLVYYANPGLQGRADMPLPTPPARSDPVSWPPKPPERPPFAAPLPTENPQRQARGSDPGAAPQPPKSVARSYYLERVEERGDGGQLKVRYRRHSCEPPNMPEVCFMPRANRRGIVVEQR